ncbi:type I glyceraldehyde-3-phosphate dehydrogenase [Candidatus Uhrbacteria bacterium]|nr:type I glyceraldehyde-3-phosphate dehydrogenase [Candidatus Uhrbacteria bacterium]
MAIRVAINGFGRIGRNTLKAILERGLDRELEVVAVNDLTDAGTLAHLLKYDTVFGRFAGTVDVADGALIVNGKRIVVVAEKDPERLPWGELAVDVVLECTGRYTKDGAARAHIRAGAKRVVVSAPTKGGDVKTMVIGVNDQEYHGEDVVNNASCTTNCVSPVTRVIHEAFGVERAVLTTVHAITAEQNVVDGPPPGLKSGDLRRARAAGFNMVPTTTGAALAVTEAIPELRGKFDGCAIRVPVMDVSLTDFVFVVAKPVTVDVVNAAFQAAAAHPSYRGVLGVTTEQLVSSDFLKSPYSAVVDCSLTKVIDGTLVKVIAWYDNEWGYSCRLGELAREVGKSIAA